MSKASRERESKTDRLSSVLGESASPFIGEGDGLTSERKRVCVLPSLVAHAIGYKVVCRRPQHY